MQALPEGLSGPAANDTIVAPSAPPANPPGPAEGCSAHTSAQELIPAALDAMAEACAEDDAMNMSGENSQDLPPAEAAVMSQQMVTESDEGAVSVQSSWSRLGKRSLHDAKLQVQYLIHMMIF